MTRRVAVGRVVWVALGLALGAWVWFADVVPSQDSATLDILVAVFSILAGVLVVLMTLSSERTLYSGSWRMASLHRAEIRRVLRRHTFLFYVYLLVVGLALAASLWDDLEVVARAALSVGVFAFVASFDLPASIVQHQQSRLDDEVERRRNQPSEPR